ncbi:hypothetical protein PROFUN_10792 [Planoprotostelium fungivorum]|uniref:Uncharacterized protein n=1 Tax=Planoprotostelium fungivorum TaxID=1890364 RepID=A0A2P6NCY3_9EUKA|nr:hypothetical protein PROFUN_10792 [Planoprotostelium fungivorum]
MGGDNRWKRMEYTPDPLSTTRAWTSSDIATVIEGWLVESLKLKNDVRREVIMDHSVERWKESHKYMTLRLASLIVAVSDDRRLQRVTIDQTGSAFCYSLEAYF